MVTEDEQTYPTQSSDDAENENKLPIHHLGDGAAALVLSKNEMCKKWNLKPLAKIIAYTEINTKEGDFVVAPLMAVKELLQKSGYKKDDVALWEIDDSTSPAVPLYVIKDLALSSDKVNVDGSSYSLGHPIAMTGARLVTHLTHALRSGQIGCAVIASQSGNAVAIMLQKISYVIENATNKLPSLTLYTKDDCFLCDELTKELKMHFDEQYTLQKVDITKKENVRFLRLYRYDIPVLFLNGQYLCMHKLNVNLLSQKLEKLRMNKNC